MAHLLHEGSRLTHDEEVALLEATRQGSKRAERRLVEGQMRHVHYAASRWYRPGVVERDDLVGVGLEALCRALRAWDPERARLSTLVQLSVQRAVRDYVERETRHVHGCDGSWQGQRKGYEGTDSVKALRCHDWSEPSQQGPAPSPAAEADLHKRMGLLDQDERQVVALIGRGLTVEQTARRMQVHRTTVWRIKRRVRRKLQGGE